MRSVGYYIRVSTDRQARVQEGSLKNQRQILDAELQRRNLQHSDWGIFVDAYVDEGLSGKNTNRPAFKRLIQDVEIGRIDTVMFTELSRLSRSLKDFLNIFEYAQKHACDLVCLKTDIDTTSPYKSLITKILMIFAEFEREMTSQRTSANAYERSKRGLANGGVAPLGYRRDKERKGYLVVDEAESKVTQEIFTTYLREQSIKRTTEAVQERHQKHVRTRITRSNVYSILTNKAYIGVREINKKGADAEEVPAVWDAIIDRETFNKVQGALRKNRGQYNRHPDRGQFVYLFSGVVRCAECGKKLQGKSAWSSTTHRRYHYYAHPGTCPNDGIQRTDARMVHQLVLGWLRDIAENGERFEELRQEGKKRIQHRVTELRAAAARIDEEIAALTAQTEARIDELTRTKADIVRRSIEASIERLESQIEEKHTERRYAEREAEQLKELLGDSSVFEHYQHEIGAVLALIDDENPRKALKRVRSLLAALAVGQEQIRIALSGLVNRKADDSTLFAFAPPVGLKANENLALIEDSIPLPGRLLLRSRSYLRRLYEGEHLSARQIGFRLGVSHSTVRAAFVSAGLNGHNGNGQRVRSGQVPFGFVSVENRLLKCEEEQDAIRLVRQLRRNGLSLRKIADELNLRLIPTKNHGPWQANTVKKILDRVAEKR